MQVPPSKPIPTHWALHMPASHIMPLELEEAAEVLEAEDALDELLLDAPVLDAEEPLEPVVVMGISVQSHVPPPSQTPPE